MKPESEELAEKLRNAGLRVTHQRMEILGEVSTCSGHPTVSHVYEAVRKRVPSISLDTVYRTMNRFMELGVIHPVGYSTEGLRFDYSREPHHHFLCVRCGEVLDFTSSGMKELPVPVEAGKLGRVQGSRLEVLGVCEKCLKEGSGKTAAENGSKEESRR